MSKGRAVATCICCATCAHEALDNGQLVPCASCGQSVSHSAVPRAEDLAAYQIVRGAKAKLKQI